MTALLVVDIGNSYMHMAVYENGHCAFLQAVPTKQILGTDDLLHIAALYHERNALSCCCISSVVPRLNELWRTAWHSITRQWPIFVSPETVQPLLPITYDQKDAIGADRLANATAAVHMSSAPILAVDIGTAGTIDVVVPDKGFIGGVIFPGIDMLFDVLSLRTAKLPRLHHEVMHEVTGRNTQQAMRCGIHWGYIGMLTELINRLKAENNIKTAPVYFTGGAAEKCTDALPFLVIYTPFLTLTGTGLIGEQHVTGASFQGV
ncbi:MAG: type III pantothenate kinase [Spartobacteria bacterium]|nr:type III pantothenate kinase [Spartobacteria bacterium]